MDTSMVLRIRNSRIIFNACMKHSVQICGHGTHRTPELKNVQQTYAKLLSLRPETPFSANPSSPDPKALNQTLNNKPYKS